VSGNPKFVEKFIDISMTLHKVDNHADDQRRKDQQENPVGPLFVEEELPQSRGWSEVPYVLIRPPAPSGRCHRLSIIAMTLPLSADFK
jgi:hypothetical protein